LSKNKELKQKVRKFNGKNFNYNRKDVVRFIFFISRHYKNPKIRFYGWVYDSAQYSTYKHSFATNNSFTDSFRIDAYHRISHKRTCSYPCYFNDIYKCWNDDFWNTYPGTDAGHEMQNFVKNLGIFAGLLVLSASNNVSQWRLFNNSW